MVNYRKFEIYSNASTPAFKARKKQVPFLVIISDILGTSWYLHRRRGELYLSVQLPSSVIYIMYVHFIIRI